MTETRECGYTGLNCGLSCKCSECFLTDVWCAWAEEYFRDMLEENPTTVYRIDGSVKEFRA